MSEEICRLCLNKIFRTNCTRITKATNTTTSIVVLKLLTCIPEIDVNLLHEFAVCSQCIEALNKAFEFKCHCVQVERLIRKYVTTVNDPGRTELSLDRLIFDATKDHNYIKTADSIQDLVTLENLNLLIMDARNLNNDTENVTSTTNNARESPELEDSNLPLVVNNADNGYRYQIQPNLNEINSEVQKIDRNKSQKGNCDLKKQSSVVPAITEPTNSPISATIAVENKRKSNADCTSNKKQVIEPNFDVCEVAFDSMEEIAIPEDAEPVNSPPAPPTNTKDVFSKHPYFVNYIQMRPGTSPFQCKMCKVKCASKSEILRHIWLHFKDNSSHYALDNCKSTKTESLLHCRVYKKPFKCDICSFRCTQRVQLTYHKRIHTGEKPYECELCDYKTRIGASLKRHVQMHLGGRIFTCRICNHECTQIHKLNLHIKTHTDYVIKNYSNFRHKRYKCYLCNCMFSCRSDLTKHTKIHETVKTLECGMCGYKCLTLDKLKQHVVVHIHV